MKKPTLKDIIYVAIIVLLVVALTVVSVLFGVSTKKNREEPSSYYDQKCAAFALHNQNASQGQIVFIGDSITDGFQLDNYFTDLPLATYNRGIGGDTTSGVLDRLKISLYDLKPSKIVLLIGINDIIGKRSETDEVLKNYREILSEIRKNLPSTEVTCLSVLPIHTTKLEERGGVDLDKFPQKIKDVNARLQPLVQEYGYRYLDLYSSLNDGSDRLIAAYTEDGLHLNADGYKVWASVIKPYLQ